MTRNAGTTPAGLEEPLLCCLKYQQNAQESMIGSRSEKLRLLVCVQVLEREERSLGSLLEDFCGVHKQKQHQRADWRQR